MTLEDEIKLVNFLLRKKILNLHFQEYARRNQSTIGIPYEELYEKLKYYHQLGYITSTANIVGKKLPAYRDELVKKLNQQRERENQEDQHKAVTRKTAQFQYKVRYYPLIISSIALFVSIYNLIDKSNENRAMKKEIEKIKMELQKKQSTTQLRTNK